jgi:uncharacterized sulfatase
MTLGSDISRLTPAASARQQTIPHSPDHIRRRGNPYTAEEALEFSRRAMPTLMSLARNGVVFTNAFSPSNLCAPARVGVLTGCLQNRFGLYQNSDVIATGIPERTALAARLQKAGYATGFIGKWHAGPRDMTLPAQGAGREGSVVEAAHPLRHGFDYYFGYNHHQCPFYDSEQIWENRKYTGKQTQYNTELFTDKALAFMKKSEESGRPFFVQISYHAVHGPLVPHAPDRYFSKFKSSSFALQNFYSHVYAVDQAIGAIRDAFGSGWDNTLLIFCGDNGAPTDVNYPLPGNAPHRGHKGTFLLGGVRVPLMMHWPRGIRGGQTRRELVSTLDSMPTALEAATVPPPAGVDGRSVLPLLQGKATKVHDHLIGAGIHARSWGFLRETTIGEGNPERRREESPGAWIITDGNYLLRFVTATPAGLFKDVPDGAPAAYELYDLREDPLETMNLYDKLPQVAEKLKAVFARQTSSYPPPSKWRRDRWVEMMSASSPR